MRYRPACRISTLIILAAISCVLATGCAQTSGTTQIDKINNTPGFDSDDRAKAVQQLYLSITGDKTLNDAQRHQRLVDAGFYESHGEDGPPPFGIITAIGGGVLLIAALMLRRTQQSSAAPATLRLSSAPSRKVQGGLKSAKSSARAAAAPPIPPRPVPPLDPVAAANDKTEVKMPANQAEVDALPYDGRGASFFTSRPMPSDALTRVYITIGAEEHKIVATREEADLISAGKMPLIRAFTIDGKTHPWYYWDTYNPFDSYWAAMSEEWQPGGRRAIACWIAVDKVDPELTGYYATLDNSKKD